MGDYGVRKYDADIGRFLSVDPLYEIYPGYTTYGYSGNDPLNVIDPSGAAIEVIDGVSTYMQGLITVYGSFTGEGFEDPFFMTLGYGSGGGGIISSMTLVGQEPAGKRNYLQEMMDRSAAQGWAFVSSSGREYMGQGSVYQNSSGRGGGGGSSNGSGNSGSSGSSFGQEKVEWNNNGITTALLISGGLLADDATGFGVVDDVAIPFVLIGGLAYAVYENKDVIAKAVQEVGESLIDIGIGLWDFMAEHTKGARPSTTGKHEKGQARKKQKETDKKRNKDTWKQNPNKRK